MHGSPDPGQRIGIMLQTARQAGCHEVVVVGRDVEPNVVVDFTHEVVPTCANTLVLNHVVEEVHVFIRIG